MNSSIIFGKHARFTVITPECIRLEYSPEGVFLDMPTLFAANRRPGRVNYKKNIYRNRLAIITSVLALNYTSDGKPFNPGNIKIIIQGGRRRITWVPGMENKRNLEGPLATLDGVEGYRKCPDGLLARDGWHLIDDSGKHVLSGGWIAVQERKNALDWFFFGYGNDYKAALRALAAVSGPVPLPRKHIFGSWYCRWWDYTSADYRRLVREYREHDFPLDVMVMDMGWHRYDAAYGYGWADNPGWSGFSWNRKLLPDAEKLLKEFRKNGIFTVLNVHPHDGIRDHEDRYRAFMKDGGVDPAGRRNIPFLAGDQRYMQAYFKHGHQPHEKIGVDFWWVDWQQDSLMPYVNGMPGLRHLPWLNHLYFKHTSRDNRRGMSFSRWGGWGDHRNPIHFSGDDKGCWEMLAFIVPFTVQSGNSGCFYWAHDLGGFWGAKDDELFARWVQFGLTNACMRVHSEGGIDRRPWKWNKSAVKSMRISFHLRSRLFPYIYSSAYKSYKEFLPLLRPMYLEFPENEKAYKNRQQYFLGDNFLAAPLTRPGTGKELEASQVVWFPEGIWYNWFTGKKYTGDSRVAVRHNLYEWPLYARGGSIIPMQSYTPRMSTEPLKHLLLRYYPGGHKCASQFDLYEDDGQTQGYLRGEHAITRIAGKQDGRSATITVEPARGAYRGQVKARAVTLEYVTEQRGISVKVNGKKHRTEYDGAEGILRITVPRNSVRKRLEIMLTPPEK